jgi:hypothetical protein
MLKKTYELREKIKEKNFEFRCANPKNMKLSKEALTYEARYFKDMALQSKNILESFVYFTKNGDGKKIRLCYDDGTLEISLSDWRFVEKKLRKFDGHCNYRHLEIAIKQGLPKEERKTAFLHEMIHAYEAELYWRKNDRMKEILLLLLYRSLMKRLGEKKVDLLLQKANKNEFWEQGHSLLFTLKSFDLDIRLKLPFGSVFGYEKKKWF